MHNNTNNSQRFRTDNSSPEAGPPVQPNVSPQPTQVPSSLTSQPAPLQPPQQATPIEEAAPNQSPSGLEPQIQPVYGHFGDSPKSRRSFKPLILVLILVVLLFGGSAAAYFTVLKKDNNKSTNDSTAQNSQTGDSEAQELAITVPENWITIDTELGFTVKAPQGWEAGMSSTTSVDNLDSKSVSISPPLVFSTDDAAQNTSENTFISVGTQKRNDVPGESEYRKLVTDPGAGYSATYEAFGIKKEDIKVTHKDVTLGGKQWIQVDVEIPGQFSRTLHHWVGDHAIVLIVIDPERSTFDKKVNDYLMPMAASVVLK